MTRHYTDLSSASDWSCRVGNLIQPIRSTSQIWVVTRHQYGIAALVSKGSFGGKTSCSVAKCRLFSQATLIPTKETKGTFSTPLLTGLGMRALDLSSLHAQKSSGSRLTKGRGKGTIECVCAPLRLSLCCKVYLQYLKFFQPFQF